MRKGSSQDQEKESESIEVKEDDLMFVRKNSVDSLPWRSSEASESIK